MSYKLMTYDELAQTFDYLEMDINRIADVAKSHAGVRETSDVLEAQVRIGILINNLRKELGHEVQL